MMVLIPCTIFIPLSIPEKHFSAIFVNSGDQRKISKGRNKPKSTSHCI